MSSTMVLEVLPLAETEMFWPFTFTDVLLLLDPAGGGSVPGVLAAGGLPLSELASFVELSTVRARESPLLPPAVLVAAAIAAINKNTPATIRTVRLLINKPC